MTTEAPTLFDHRPPHRPATIILRSTYPDGLDYPTVITVLLLLEVYGHGRYLDAAITVRPVRP